MAKPIIVDHKLAIPLETEACCFADFSCENRTVDDCTANLGTPQGVGTACSDRPPPCEPPPGDPCPLDCSTCPDTLTVSMTLLFNFACSIVKGGAALDCNGFLSFSTSVEKNDPPTGCVWQQFPGLFGTCAAALPVLGIVGPGPLACVVKLKNLVLRCVEDVPMDPRFEAVLVFDMCSEAGGGLDGCLLGTACAITMSTGVGQGPNPQGCPHVVSYPLFVPSAACPGIIDPGGSSGSVT